MYVAQGVAQVGVDRTTIEERHQSQEGPLLPQMNKAGLVTHALGRVFFWMLGLTRVYPQVPSPRPPGRQLNGLLFPNTAFIASQNNMLFVLFVRRPVVHRAYSVMKIKEMSSRVGTRASKRVGILQLTKCNYLPMVPK